MSHTHFNTKKSKGHLKFTERELIQQWLKEDKKQLRLPVCLAEINQLFHVKSNGVPSSKLVKVKKSEVSS